MQMQCGWRDRENIGPYSSKGWGIFINKHILLHETPLAEYEPLQVNACEKLALAGILMET